MLSCPPDLSPLTMTVYQPCRGDRFRMKSARSRNFPRLKLGLLVASLLICVLPYGRAALTQAQRPGRRPANRDQRVAARPRLVLLIVVDQFRYDYLTRFGDLFGSRGIGRLMRDGASWTETNFDHVPTFTAPGHAVFMTGASPSQTGIVANEWYERETGRRVKSITD